MTVPGPRFLVPGWNFVLGAWSRLAQSASSLAASFSTVSLLHLLSIFGLWILCAGVAGAQVHVDGLIAITAERVLMLSDLRLARDLERVPPGLTDDEVRDRLIDRALMVAEVERFQPPDPPASRVEALLAETRDKAGPQRWAAALRRAGVDENHVRALIRDDLRLDAYLRQRFQALAQPGSEEVRDEVERRVKSAQPGPSVDAKALEAQVREELSQSRYNQLVAQWVAELRGRAER